MKPRMMLSGVILLALIQIGGWAQGKYVPAPNEMFYGTWTNDKITPQKTVAFPGGWKNYNLISDANPVEEGTEQIVEKWTDPEGNIWYKSYGTITKGEYIGMKWQSLHKFNKSGTVREYTWAQVFGDFNPTLPPKIDPTDVEHYRLYYRAKE
jgi:hypothetical protein